MVKLLRCPCLNVSIHLNEAPRDEPDVQWLKNYTSMREIGKGELAVAGITTEVEKLVTSRVISYEWSRWKCVTCKNCDVDVYAIQLSNPTHPVVNMAFLNLSETPKISDHFSNIFHIILEDTDEIANTILDTPDVLDIDIWNKIQKQVEDFLKKEEQEMQKRIDEFTRQERDGFAISQTRAYRDRKILWHKICKNEHKLPSGNWASGSKPKTSSTGSSSTAPRNQSKGSPQPSQTQAQAKSYVPSISKPVSKTPTPKATQPQSKPQPTSQVVGSINRSVPISASVPKPALKYASSSFEKPPLPRSNVPSAKASATPQTITASLSSSPTPAITPTDSTPIVTSASSPLMIQPNPQPIRSVAASAPVYNRFLQNSNFRLFSFEDDEDPEPELEDDLDDQSTDETETAKEDEDPPEQSIIPRKKQDIPNKFENDIASQIYGSSVPVNIPMKPIFFNSESHDDDDFLEGSVQSLKKPHEFSWVNDSTEMSRSFAVPVSLTKKIKGYL